ncbi:L-type lectin-domain containing receptor kinase IX.1-like, partial [Prunus avium]|uniref:L-type lectin-domain containing receptor kinase IX.1-like n=1 Tax=Prunus avium TaxID=42229 RepID=A0A6P5T5W7_PRUAV
FSASTGANSALHNIISWNFTSTSLVDHESLALSGQEETKDETPVPAPGPTSKFKARKRKKPLAVVIGSSIGGFILVCFLGLGLYNSCKKKATRTTTDGNPNDLIHEFEGTSSLKIFPYEELVLATRYFFEGEKLGEGGSEVEIYKGYMTYLNSYVAVKKISRGAKHWIDLYAQQLRIISQCRHRNLVQLIGWCHEKGELLLVYEFVPNGSLETHLFKSESLLFWESRYRIVLGMASGLLYLHEGGRQPLLHTNIKPSNVMVDSNFNAKLRDFGLGHRREPQMITTSYTAPEYFIGPLRNKSDVFSFGIVALEISCGRKLIDPKFEGSQVDMVEWVWELYVEGKVIKAADPKLHGDFNDKQMECLLIVGLWCAHENYILRPSMRQAFCALNFEDPLPILPSRMPMGTSPPATTLSRSPSTIGSEGGQMESGYGNATNCSEITESSAMESGYGNATNCSEIIESSVVESGNATNCSEITESSAIESGYGNATNSSEITESSAVESGYGNATNCSEITESSAMESGYSNATNSSKITESSAMESGY